MIGPQSVGEVMNGLYGGEPTERMPVVRTGERPPVDPLVRRGVWLRDNGRCSWCGSSERGQMVLDHIVPWSAGGSDRSENLRVLCWDCNTERSNFRTDSAGARALPVSSMCTRCSGYYDRQDDVDDVPIGVPEPMELGEPVAAFCVTCRSGGTADRAWTR